MIGGPALTMYNCVLFAPALAGPPQLVLTSARMYPHISYLTSNNMYINIQASL